MMLTTMKPYSPHPQGDYALDQYPAQGEQYHPEHDDVPILQPTPFSSDGQEEYQDDYIPKPAGSTPAPRRWKTIKEVQLFNGNLVPRLSDSAKVIK